MPCIRLTTEKTCEGRVYWDRKTEMKAVEYRKLEMAAGGSVGTEFLRKESIINKFRKEGEIMPTAGNSYTITLKKAHLEWGTHRYTGSRGLVYGEGYIPIPGDIAELFNIYNGNNRSTGLGFNIYNCTSADGHFSGTVKAAGSRHAGDIYAKQFEGNGDLKAIGTWFAHCNARVGDHVEVIWTSSTDIVIRHY